ncbi:membrane dipeptidase [Rhizobium sp. AU243]|uniref:dipeptidase n=1 Tax=Rhizobium sp. AU243 TaxID=2303425 RepID=UPI0014859728|nr:membrane dipeptidase [Rhizobium sp. AU243]
MLIDGLVLPALDNASISDMYNGGLDAAVYPAAIWHDTADALHQFAKVRRVIMESDRGVLIRSAGDIVEARRSGGVGIVIGWQNSDGLGGNLDLLPMYHELGLRTLSIAFNYANSAGAGCYERSDGGLTSFGRELVAVCNDVGILLDLTHVGDRTGADVVSVSRRPVCYSHASPRHLQDSVRNKTDEQLRAVAETGGIVGLAALPHYLPNELHSTVADYLAVVEHVLNVVGEEHVGFGTDMTPGQSSEFLAYTASRKGFGSATVDYSVPPRLSGLSNFSDYQDVLDRLVRALGPRKTEKFAGENWLRVFRDTWS